MRPMVVDRQLLLTTASPDTGISLDMYIKIHITLQKIHTGPFI